MKSFFVCFLGILAGATFPGDARAENAQTIPRGRFRLGLTYGMSNGITDTFNSAGNRERVVGKYNVDLSSVNLSTYVPQVKELIDALNATNLSYNPSHRQDPSHGIVSYDASLPRLGDALELGFLGVGGHASQQVYNFSLAHGVTDQLTVGILIPFIKTDVQIDAGVSGTNTASDIYQFFQSSGFSGLGPQGQNLANTLQSLTVPNQTLASMLRSFGYSDVENFNASGIGDVVLGTRYNYFNGDVTNVLPGHFINSFQLGIKAPTGRVYSPRQVTAIDFGQGAWDATVAHLMNYTPSRFLTLETSFNYTYRFRGMKLKMIKQSADDLLPSIEENVNEKMGDKFWAQLGGKLTFTDYLFLRSTYEWYWKGKNHYIGSQPGIDYSLIAADTDTYLETLSAELTLSSINAFLNYKFPLPGELVFTYYHPVRGRNTIIAPFATAELVLFF
ncbi:MAG: hypothetical protein AB7P04_13605 [Bacteriovoracia bacterium]